MSDIEFYWSPFRATIAILICILAWIFLWKKDKKEYKARVFLNFVSDEELTATLRKKDRRIILALLFVVLFAVFEGYRSLQPCGLN